MQNLSFSNVISSHISTTYNQRVAFYQSPNEVFGRVVQGLFELNIEKSTANEISITNDVAEFLKQFQYTDGTPVFKHSLERAQAAHELAYMNIRYKFLKDQDSWVMDGVDHEWQSKNMRMELLYLSLMSSLQSVHGGSQPLI